MIKKTRILLLFGGRSGEYDVSINSARSVHQNLDREKYEIIQVGITQTGRWMSSNDGKDVIQLFCDGDFSTLYSVLLLPFPTDGNIFLVKDLVDGEKLVVFATIDVVFPVLHGTFGEDGTLQGLLELADLPYVGAGVLGSAVGMDKGIFKDLMRAYGIPVVESIVVLRSEIKNDIDSVIEKAELISEYPIFIKPANLGSSVGVSKCNNRSDLMEGLFEAARFDRRILIEKGLNAREIEISVIGNEHPRCTIPGEILPSRDFYTYEAKYLDGTSQIIIPAQLPDHLLENAKQIALEAYRIMDCAGMARVDFLLDVNDNRLYLNEVNTIPGFTEISMYPKLWNAGGMNYTEVLDKLIELAFDRKSERDQTEHKFSRGDI